MNFGICEGPGTNHSTPRDTEVQLQLSFGGLKSYTQILDGMQHNTPNSEGQLYIDLQTWL